MTLRGETLDVSWNARESRAFFDGMESTGRALCRALGGRMWRPGGRFGRLITVHPLGGCPMGETRRTTASSTPTGGSSAPTACTSRTARSCPGRSARTRASRSPRWPSASPPRWWRHDRDHLPRVARRIRRLRRRRLERGLDRRARGPQPLRDPPRRVGSTTSTLHRPARAPRALHGLGPLRRPRRAASRSRRAGSTCSSTRAARATATCATACMPRDATGRPITFVGFKDVHDDALPRPVGRHVDALQPPLRRAPRGRARTRADARLAAGVLRVTRAGFLGLLLSIRARGAGPAGRLAAKARWGAMFASRLAGVYAGPAQDGQPDFPSPRPGTEPFQGFPAGRVARGPRPAGARAADPARSPPGDGRTLTLHHLRRTPNGAPRRADRARAGPARPRHRRAGEPLLHAAAAHDARRRAPRRRPRRLARDLARLDRPRHVLVHAGPGRGPRPPGARPHRARGDRRRHAEGGDALPGVDELHDGGARRASCRR